MISRSQRQTAAVHSVTVSTSCTSQSVCIYLSSQSDKPLCKPCRQLPMTTVRYTLISAGKLSCEGREHQGHMSAWCSVVIRRIHRGDGCWVQGVPRCLHYNSLFWFCHLELLLSHVLEVYEDVMIWHLVGQFGHACLLFASYFGFIQWWMGWIFYANIYESLSQY